MRCAIYDRALDLAEVQQAQLNGALPPVPVTHHPAAGQPDGVRRSTGDLQRRRPTAPPPSPTSGSGARWTLPARPRAVTPWTQPPRRQRCDLPVKVSNAATPAGVWSDAATLTVLAENGHKVFLSFSEGGATVTNLGNLAGNGRLRRDGRLPGGVRRTSPRAPSPATDNFSAVDFGGIAAGQGGPRGGPDQPHRQHAGAHDGLHRHRLAELQRSDRRLGRQPHRLRPRLAGRRRASISCSWPTARCASASTNGPTAAPAARSVPKAGSRPTRPRAPPTGSSSPSPTTAPWPPGTSPTTSAALPGRQADPPWTIPPGRHPADRAADHRQLQQRGRSPQRDRTRRRQPGASAG